VCVCVNARVRHLPVAGEVSALKATREKERETECGKETHMLICTCMCECVSVCVCVCVCERQSVKQQQYDVSDHLILSKYTIYLFIYGNKKETDERKE